MTPPIRISVDFLKRDRLGRLLLTTVGTTADLAKHGIERRDGLALAVYGDDADETGTPDHLIGEGVVSYDDAAKRWVLEIDWDGIHHETDSR
jgi:hypothetical protein